MFHFFSSARKKTKRSLSQRTILHVEALEGRDCPSAPPTAPPFTGPAVTVPVGTETDPGMSLSLSVAQGPNRTVNVTGQVSSSASPTGGRTVTLSGVISGSVTTNADGTFAYTGPANALGQIQAAVTDDSGVTVTSSAMLTDAPPTIINFQAVNNGGTSWTFTGQVQHAYAPGLVVTLRGLPSLDSSVASAPVQTSGSFSYTITLQPGENGSVTAACTDWWGQASNEATAVLS
jgi:hypothetical protein